MRQFPSLLPAFLGNAGAQPIGAGMPVSVKSQAMPLIIDWRAQALAAGANGAGPIPIGIVFDLKKLYVTNSMEAVKSVYVDNFGVEQAVYVRCDDTGQVVPCAANKAGVFQLLTNGEGFTVFVDDVTALRDNNRLTRLIFSNVSFVPFGF